MARFFTPRRSLQFIIPSSLRSVKNIPSVAHFVIPNRRFAVRNLLLAWPSGFLAR
jgi:hypothetical protein